MNIGANLNFVILRHLATNDPRCLLSEYYQTEPEDSGIDLSMASLNKHIAAQNTPATPAPAEQTTIPTQNIPTNLPENHAICALDMPQNTVLATPNTVSLTPNVVNIAPNDGQFTPNVVNTNPRLGDILTNLTTFGVKSTPNHPNLGGTKNKNTKNTTTNTADSAKSTPSPKSKVNSKSSKKSKAKQKHKNKQQSKAERDCANQHEPNTSAKSVPQSDTAPQNAQENPAKLVPPAEDESLLFFSKQKEQAIIATIEAKLDAKMQNYGTQISQMNQSIADIVQGLNQVQQSIQATHAQGTRNTEAMENTASACPNTTMDYQANVDEYNQMQQTAAQDYSSAKLTPKVKCKASKQSKKAAKTNTKTTTAHDCSKTNLQARNYLSCLSYPANLRYSEQRGMADLLSPIEQNDAQMLLDILADRMENGVDPVNRTVAYLSRLLQKYYNDDLDKSRYVSSEEKAQQQAEKTAAKHASEVRSEYEAAVIDHKDMLRNFGYHAEGEGMTHMEYFTSRDLKSFWEKIEQRLYAAQAAMEKLNNG